MNRVGFMPGLDIRADNAYIVAPPSMHASGNKYSWIVDEPPEPMPSWLLELLDDNPKRDFPKSEGLIKPGCRNSTLASIAGLLRRHGLEVKQIYNGITAINNAICKPPLKAEEVERIAVSISHYEKPSTWPAIKPLPVETYEAQSLTDIQVPASIRGWVLDVSERMQVPLEFMAVPAIVAAASLIGRKLSIRPDREDSWGVIPNLWGFIVAEPGSLKSPAIAEAMRPLEMLAKLAS